MEIFKLKDGTITDIKTSFREGEHIGLCETCFDFIPDAFYIMVYVGDEMCGDIEVEGEKARHAPAKLISWVLKHTGSYDMTISEFVSWLAKEMGGET